MGAAPALLRKHTRMTSATLRRVVTLALVVVASHGLIAPTAHLIPGGPAPTATVKVNGPGDVTFINPMQTGGAGGMLPLDVCLSYGQQCGNEAANAYCRRMRYDSADSFATAR